MTPLVVNHLLCLALLFVSALWLCTLLEVRHYRHWKEVWRKHAKETLEMAQRHSDASFKRYFELIDLCRKINQSNAQLLAKVKQMEDDGEGWKRGKPNGD